MPSIKLWEHGTCAGVRGNGRPDRGGPKDKVGGWSPSSIRNNTRFLYSVRTDELTGLGLSLTLTVRDCPPSHREWQAVRRAFIERLRRDGLIRGHWLTEWQRRGVPHLHCAVWIHEQPGRHSWEERKPWWAIREQIVIHWLAVAERFGAHRSAQTVTPMWDALGWLQYVAKHGARGLHHYQRSADSMPAGWRGTTGRMWGYLGEWPRRDAMQAEVSMSAFWRWRRLLRSRFMAAARCEGPRKIHAARTMLRCPDPNLSAVRGVSQWLELSDQLLMLEVLRQLGHNVRM